MSTIYDRCKLGTVNLRHISNLASHSKEVAAVCARISSMSYAMTASAHARGVEWIPHADLLAHLTAFGRPESVREWFGDGETPPSFSTSVPGGAAFGVAVGDTLVIGFRGTTDGKDWSINLFRDGGILPLKIPVRDDHHLQYYLEGRGDSSVFFHGGFYRVANALAAALDAEINAFRNVHAARRVLLCGHSLGGALALLAGRRIRHDAVYTFGSPRVSSPPAVLGLPDAHFRYTLEGDPVPAVPFRTLGFVQDCPAICLDPYADRARPGPIRKFITGFRNPDPSGGRLSKGVIEMAAAEHDLGLYIRMIDLT